MKIIQLSSKSDEHSILTLSTDDMDSRYTGVALLAVSHFFLPIAGITGVSPYPVQFYLDLCVLYDAECAHRLVCICRLEAVTLMSLFYLLRQLSS